MRQETYSRLASKLQPHLRHGFTPSVINITGDGGDGGPGGSAAPGIPDYTIELTGGNCVAYATDGTVAFSGANHATVIQSAITEAGINGALAFRPGDYWIDTQLAPLARQSWYCPFGAVFHPLGNNRILFLQDKDWFALYGTLHIEDTDRHTTSVEAIFLDGVNGCYFQDIMVWDYYRGMAIWGTTRRSYENIFENIRLQIMRHEGLVIKQEVGDNYFNNVFIKGPSTVEWATGSGFIIGLYPGVGYIFGGIMFGRVEVLDCFVNIDLQGLYECWFDQILSDNAYFAAIYIGDAVQRLFIGGIWTAGSGDGLWIQGSAASSVRRIRINGIFSWINAQFGIHFNGYIDDVYIGTAYLLENQVAQLKYSRGNITNVHIANINVVDSNLNAIDCGGLEGTENVAITHADIDDGECMGLDLLRSIDGQRNGKPFQNDGVAYINSGSSFVTVAHGLENKPKHIDLTAFHYDARQAFISAYDATNFLIDAGATVGALCRVAWVARSGVEVGNELLLNPNVDTGSPSNWAAINGAFVETSDVYNGSKALRINAGLAEWASDPVAVSAGGRYRLRAYVRGTGNTFARLGIRWFDGPGGTGALLDGSVLPLVSLSDYVTGYVKVQGDYTAPFGAESGVVVFRNAAADTTDVYADDFDFHLVSGGANLLTNASVESGSGSPTDWVLDGVTWENTGRTGSKSLRATNASTQKQARVTWVSVSPSTAYAVGAWLQGTAAGNVALVVQWFSDSGGIGNLIKEDTRYITGVYGSWTNIATSFTSPASAQSAYIVFRMVGWVAYDIKADAFSLRQLL